MKMIYPLMENQAPVSMTDSRKKRNNLMLFCM